MDGLKLLEYISDKMGAVFQPGTIKVQFSEMLNYENVDGTSNMIYIDKENTIMIPENQYYKLIFYLEGVTDKSVKECCDHALAKIYKRIDSYK